MFFRIEYLCTFTDSQTLSLFRTALQKEHNQSLESIHCMSFQEFRSGEPPKSRIRVGFGFRVSGFGFRVSGFVD